MAEKQKGRCPFRLGHVGLKKSVLRLPPHSPGAARVDSAYPTINKVLYLTQPGGQVQRRSLHKIACDFGLPGRVELGPGETDISSIPWRRKSSTGTNQYQHA